MPSPAPPAPASRPSRDRVLLLGVRGTRWLFSIALLSGLLAWASEAAGNRLDPLDRIGYPLLCLSLAMMLAGVVWRPQQLRLWQRGAATLVPIYFTGLIVGLTLRDDPGPSFYTLATLGPWMLGGLLLLFTTWRAGHALGLGLAFLGIILLPATLRRFGGASPDWLLEAWPLLLNSGTAMTMYCLALWGLSRQLARLADLAPQIEGQATTTELARARVAELERSQVQIEAASRAKSEFLAALGHEIRTPMNTVLGMTQLVLAEPLPSDQRQRLKQAQRAGENLLRMIDSLLDFATLDSGRLQLHLGALRVEQLVASAVDTIRPAAQAKQLELLCEFASPDLLGDEGWRRGDAARIQQVLTELLSNAVKFTAKGQIRLRASLKAEGEQTWLRLRVRDSGIGIPAEQLPQIFTPFVQAEAGMARRFGGTGLGLAIAHRLMRLMGGQLIARSGLERGSEFEMRLPLPRCAPPRPDRPIPPQRIMLVQAAHSPGHEALREQIRLLAPQSELLLAAQGGDALASLAELPLPLDLLIIDWVLPDMDGSDLLQELASHLPALAARRIVLLSAFDTAALRERAVRLGAQLLVLKPLLPPLLRTLLDPRAALPPMELAAPLQAPSTTDRAKLVTDFDELLASADSRAVSLWETQQGELMEMLPAQQVKVLAGAMERLDFDSAQAALRHAQPHKSPEESR